MNTCKQFILTFFTLVLFSLICPRTFSLENTTSETNFVQHFLIFKTFKENENCENSLYILCYRHPIYKKFYFE